MKAVWEFKSLSEVCQIRPPKSEAKKKLADADLVSFVPMENLGINEQWFEAKQTRTLAEVAGSYTYFADGDVLLAKITPCFENGKLGIASGLMNGIGFGSSEFIVFRPDNSLDKQWLYHFLSRESFRQEGQARMTGAVGHKRVAKEFIEEYQIPIPPISEQQRIVAILDEAFEGITTAKANAEKNLQNARALFESRLQSLFVSNLETWQHTTLEEIVDSECSLSYGIVQPGEDFEGGLPIVRPTDLVSRLIELDGLKRIDPSLASGYKRTSLRGGELLLCVRGSTGVISLASENLRGCNVTRGIVPIMFDQSLVCSDFGYFLMISDFVQSQIREKTYGTALMQINIRDLRKIEVLIPSIEVQKRIALSLTELSEEVQRLEAIYQQKLSALDELRKALLQQAFSGEL